MGNAFSEAMNPVHASNIHYYCSIFYTLLLAALQMDFFISSSLFGKVINFGDSIYLYEDMRYSNSDMFTGIEKNYIFICGDVCVEGCFVTRKRKKKVVVVVTQY